MLRQLKNQFEELFSEIKTAVIVGKDRQSDLLSYSTCDDKIQSILKNLKTYQIIRIPEDILSHTEKAKTQKEIISPVAVAANKNGEVFVLDSAAACIHVVDRSSVAKVTILGGYKSDDVQRYKKNTPGSTKAKDIMLSNGVTDLIYHRDNVFVSDAVRNEIAVILNGISASSISSCKLRVLILDKCISLCCMGENLVVLRKDGMDSIIDIIELGNLNVSFFPSFKIITTLKSSDTKSLFSLSLNYFGTHTENKAMSIYIHNEKNGIEKIHSELAFSQCRPCFSAEMNYLFSVGVESSSHLSANSITLSSTSVNIKNMKKTHCNLSPLIVGTWGETIFMICSRESKSFVLVEMGSLEFASLFCHSVQNLYKAVSYVPPKGDNSVRNMKLSECIALAVNSVDLFNKMQISLEERFPGRSSFAGANGVIWSQTLKCINSSIESLKVVEKRLKQLNNGFDLLVYCHALLNESYVEHSFGSQTQKGQGQLQNKQEYCISKRRNQVNFQIKMCDTPFNQYSKIKKRDQGYQALRDGELKLSVRDLKDIFSESEDKKELDVQLTDGEIKILNHAFNLAKSVPRQSNRCKWREKAGFAPNMLQPTLQNSGKLYVGDLVFFQSFSNKILDLVVAEEVILATLEVPLKVCLLQGAESVLTINLSQLLQNNGQAVVVPAEFYHLEDGKMKIQENVSYLFDKLTNKRSLLPDDPAWDPLYDDLCMAAESVEASSLQENRKCVPTGSKKRKLKVNPKNKTNGSRYQKPGHLKDAVPEDAVFQENDVPEDNVPRADAIVDSDEDDIDLTLRSGRLKKLKVVYSDEEEDDVENNNDLDSQNNELAIGSYVQVISGPFDGLYASVREKIDEKFWRIEYFQQQYGKWTLKEGDVDSKLSSELKLVVGTPDNRGRFTFVDLF